MNPLQPYWANENKLEVCYKMFCFVSYPQLCLFQSYDLFKSGPHFDSSCISTSQLQLSLYQGSVRSFRGLLECTVPESMGRNWRKPWKSLVKLVSLDRNENTSLNCAKRMVICHCAWPGYEPRTRSIISTSQCLLHVTWYEVFYVALFTEPRCPVSVVNWPVQLFSYNYDAAGNIHRCIIST
jgi:hypothetical protein